MEPIKTNCPNCGSPLEPYKCRCEYCGTYYFDFVAFDMSQNVPYYVKFRTPLGIITTLARPELSTIEYRSEDTDIIGAAGNKIAHFITNKYCDLNVIFHAQLDNNKTLFTLERLENEN